MKNNKIPKSALMLLICGLLVVTITPVIGRYLLISDFLRGFLTGLGLMLEFLALVKIKRSKKMQNAHGCSTNAY